MKFKLILAIAALTGLAVGTFDASAVQAADLDRSVVKKRTYHHRAPVRRYAVEVDPYHYRYEPLLSVLSLGLLAPCRVRALSLASALQRVEHAAAVLPVLQELGLSGAALAPQGMACLGPWPSQALALVGSARARLQRVQPP